VAVAAQEVTAVEDDGGRWPLLAAGGALLVTGVGLAVVSGGRRSGTRSQAPPPLGSA
jgi:hypothetical protein